MLGAPPICGTIPTIGRVTASANTVFRRVIPPYCSLGPGGVPKIFQVDPSSTSTSAPKNNFSGNSDGFTHITDLWYTSLSTAHSLYLLRPLNYTWATTAQAANTTTITVAFDPGTWATAGVYKYGVGTAGGVPALGNNTQASGDIYAFQCSDGSWVVDAATTNTSGTTLILTTGVPNVTGITLPAYSPIYWFGAVGDTDPATGLIQPLLDTIVNTNVTFRTANYGIGLWNSLHRGDPLVFHSSNGTDAGILELLAGYYSTIF